MALTQYYCNPAIAGNSGTGTSGDPFGDLQYALDTISRDSTNGDQINVKSGTSEILAASLSLSTYGTPTTTAPLVIRGYTTTAGDGGVGVIDGNATYSIINSSGADSTHFIDLRLTNSGSNAVVSNMGTNCIIYNCEIDTTSGSGVAAMGVRGLVIGCNVHDVATLAGAARYGIALGNVGCKAIANRVQLAIGNASGAAIYVNTANSSAENNIVRIGNTGSGILTSSAADGAQIKANSVYAAASTGEGINVVSGAEVSTVANNIVEGFSGAGGDGILIAGTVLLYHSNAWYNNTTNETVSGVATVNTNNDLLSASAFVNAGADDFDINGTVTGATEDGWPATFLGASSTASKADKGASQAGAGAGSSGGGPVFGGMVVR